MLDRLELAGLKAALQRVPDSIHNLSEDRSHHDMHICRGQGQIAHLEIRRGVSRHLPDFNDDILWNVIAEVVEAIDKGGVR